MFSGNAARSLREDGLAGACLVFDEQSLSFGDRDAQGQSGGENDKVSGNLHRALQFRPSHERAAGATTSGFCFTDVTKP